MIKKMLSVIGLTVVLMGVAAGTANAGPPCEPSPASACWGWPK
ncbi:hypothetical protein OG474_19720 [Kribbella sp. NBC_01505]